MRGVERFREHFRRHAGQFVLIGGVAADAWFTRAGLPFRVTKDLDVVLLVEALDDAFLRSMWEFVRAGGYARTERGGGRRTYFRFVKPADPAFPEMLELFSRAPDGILVPAGREVVPIPADEDASSLSAILMDDDYYRLVAANRETLDDLAYVTPACLILLKACAWGELTARRARGEGGDERGIRKHRNDVFHLAALLPADGRMAVAPRIHADLERFLDAFPADAPEWPAIEQALRFDPAWPGARVVAGVLRSYFERQ